MRAIILIILCSLTASAQTVTLPTWVADSLIYEAKLSRQCSQVMQAQQDEIKALSIELVHTGTALKLSQSESKTLESLVSNARESNKIQGEQFAIDLGKQKRKTKKWRNGFFILIAVIAVREGLNTLD